MIDENKLAERFSQDVDKLIQNPLAEIIPAGPAPEEYSRHIELARFMTAVLTDRRRLREELRQRLINKVNRASNRAGGIGGGELDDDQLDLVAAGTGSEANYDQHAAFVCNRSASAITGDICPDCGRLRSLHPGG